MYRNLMSLFRRGDRRAAAELAQLDDYLLADIGLDRSDLRLVRSGRFDRSRLRTHE
ncbi:MAG TPA: DUF1127 domain-containing protein [Alphaproteobacteria bacterium]|nr:DUF1127 domain-containing protein [Alphaproteobacteria bacterium]